MSKPTKIAFYTKENAQKVFFKANRASRPRPKKKVELVWFAKCHKLTTGKSVCYQVAFVDKTVKVAATGEGSTRFRAFVGALDLVCCQLELRNMLA